MENVGESISSAAWEAICRLFAIASGMDLSGFWPSAALFGHVRMSSTGLCRRPATYSQDQSSKSVSKSSVFKF